jgi:hypothetical protein
MLRPVLTRDHQSVVPERFSGFPGIAHGGYLSGLVADGVGAPTVEVRLRRPVRIDVPMTLERRGHKFVELRHGEVLIAEGAATEIAIEVPEPVDLAEAEAASRRYPGLDHHLYPACFGCGPARPDGLRIFPGPVPGRRLVAADWIPAAADAGENGSVPPALVWAALDCPQVWSLILHAPSRSREKVVTGTLAVKLERPVVAGVAHIVLAWPRGGDGRGWVADAAVLGPEGDICATGRQTAVPAHWGVPLGLAQWSEPR